MVIPSMPGAPPLAFTCFHARSMFSRERIRSSRSSEAPPCFPSASREAIARPAGLVATVAGCGVEEPLTSLALREVASPLLCPRLRGLARAHSLGPTGLWLRRIPVAPAPTAPVCSARRPLLDAAPGVATEPGEQISLSKDVNSACANGPFTSGPEHWAWLCGATSPGPSASHDLGFTRRPRAPPSTGLLPAVEVLSRLPKPLESVRRLIRFD